MGAGFLLDDSIAFSWRQNSQISAVMLRIVEYSVLLLESDAFQKNSWFVCWNFVFIALEAGKVQPVLPTHQKKEAANCSPPATLCPVVDFKNDSIGIFPCSSSGLIALTLGVNWIV